MPPALTDLLLTRVSRPTLSLYPAPTPRGSASSLVKVVNVLFQNSILCNCISYETKLALYLLYIFTLSSLIIVLLVILRLNRRVAIYEVPNLIVSYRLSVRFVSIRKDKIRSISYDRDL